MANMMLLHYGATRNADQRRNDDERRPNMATENPYGDDPYKRMSGDTEMRRGRSPQTGRYVRRSENDMRMGENRRIGFGETRNDGDRYSTYDDYMPRSHYGHEHEQEDDEEGILWLDQERRKRYEQEDEGDDEITKEKAEHMVSKMIGSDPAHPRGGRWKMDEVKPLAQRCGFPTGGKEFYEFFVVLNAMYSDYFDVAKKFGVNNPDFFAELAKCFIKDKDANPNKVEMYFKHIAKS